MAAELTQLRNDPVSWVEDTIMEFVMACGLAAAVAFPLHLVLNPLSAVIGYPHGIGGFWACALVALGLITVARLLAHVVNIFTDEVRKGDALELMSLMVAVGAAAWIVTWILTGSAT